MGLHEFFRGGQRDVAALICLLNSRFIVVCDEQHRLAVLERGSDSSSLTIGTFVVLQASQDLPIVVRPWSLLRCVSHVCSGVTFETTTVVPCSADRTIEFLIAAISRLPYGLCSNLYVATTSARFDSPIDFVVDVSVAQISSHSASYLVDDSADHVVRVFAANNDQVLLPSVGHRILMLGIHLRRPRDVEPDFRFRLTIDCDVGFVVDCGRIDVLLRIPKLSGI
jgi:hypothetical protein